MAFSTGAIPGKARPKGRARTVRPCPHRCPPDGVVRIAARRAPAGQIGERCVRGRQGLAGCCKYPFETAAMFNLDVWLRTRDRGPISADGVFKVSDLKKDMIAVCGVKLLPNPVEDAVALQSGGSPGWCRRRTRRTIRRDRQPSSCAGARR